ncbi:ribonuclease HII [Methanosphaerula palustris]|uniref:Ribonuclease HII n=1 Tax=Methanosphaerula palustris (strain ATCC BAA-1556 / DSM 19958 / E1-9c) TaxID=521011 RepID=B8GGR0_METPE|nr:ribonuclease HII [Methanosphaerula palustris]ACL16315.1 ribonuclease HII [Methanosphaerula palustris E1-9c]
MLMPLICGVDEAGKGAVLGPMVVAGVASRDVSAVAALGVRDSKQLTRLKREDLYDQIRSICTTTVTVLSAADIDLARESATMNMIVARGHAAVISTLTPTLAYVDACDVNADRYRETVTALLEPAASCQVIAEHRADSTYPIVAAASIIAKVTRDRLVDALADECGQIGSGYPSDRYTIAYLSDYIRRHHAPPACARKSWKTTIHLLEERAQRDIRSYL